MAAPPGSFPLEVLIDRDGAPLEVFLRRAVAALRAHLGMRVAFVSVFDGGRRRFRVVDADSAEERVVEGGSDPDWESFCRHVADGRIPELLIDAALHPFARTLAATSAFPVGAHVSVPLRLADGHVYGTLCCFDVTPDPTLGMRDLLVLKAVAAIVTARLDEEAVAASDLRHLAAALDVTIAEGHFRFLAQPIRSADDLEQVGIEVLTRFDAFGDVSPPAVFAHARRCGRDTELTLAILAALFGRFGARRPEGTVFFNIAPNVVVDEAVREALLRLPCRVVVELTERDAYEVEGALAAALDALRAAGVRIAIDDIGVGYSSLDAALKVAPEYLKLDGSLVKGVAVDRKRAAMLRALSAFAAESGCALIAEGVEDAPDLSRLRDLGVNLVQGWYVGRPEPL